MHLSCIFENQELKIELLKNPVVDKWLASLSPNSKWQVNANRLSNVDYDLFSKSSKNSALITAIKHFNDQFPDNTFPFEVNDQTLFSNDNLNSIHRFFTSATCYRSWYPHQPPIDPANIDHWYRELDKINLAVHDLQLHYPNKRKSTTTDVCLLELSNLSAREYMHDVGDWQYLDYDLTCNVFLQHCICGKDSFQAYIDNDDCRHFDVMSQWNSVYNSFYIDVNNSRNTVMQGNLFREWLIAGRKYNTAWQYMPLGKIDATIDVQSLGTLKEIKLNDC